MNIVILLAAGSSVRFGYDKLWADVFGEPLWTLAYKTLLTHPKVDKIILVVGPGERKHFAQFLKRADALRADSLGGDKIPTKNTILVAGGKTRMASFKNGLAASHYSPRDIILDHNAANPRVTPEEISAVLGAAKKHGAAAVCHEVVDTLVEIQDLPHKKTKSKNCDIVTILERKNFRLMQTPQAARGDVLIQAGLMSSPRMQTPHGRATRAQTIHERPTRVPATAPDPTDLTSALVPFTPVKLLPAHPLNKKITFKEDLQNLRAQRPPMSGSVKERCYLGEDSHRFMGKHSHRFNKHGPSVRNTLVLGGLTIPGWPAMEANSDGDVILHAIGRALAQAQGHSFSETADALCEQGEKSSAAYLKPFLHGINIHNLSLTLEGQRPSIDPLIPSLKKSLRKILKLKKLKEDQIQISAHTGEGLTPFGKGQGLRCLALMTVSNHLS